MEYLLTETQFSGKEKIIINTLREGNNENFVAVFWSEPFSEFFGNSQNRLIEKIQDEEERKDEMQ